MKIRKASMNDVPALNALIPQSVRQLSMGYYTPDQIRAALEHMIGLDTQLIADETYYVAEENGSIVGAGGWSRRRTMYGGDHWKTAEDPLLDPRTEAARIRAFFVHPDRARRGIGRSLLLACERAALAEGFSHLELMATLPGEPLYLAMGFQPGERIEIALEGRIPFPAVRMTKILC